MKYTKQLLFVVLLAVVIFSTDALAGEVDLKINNVGLGTSYETVVKNLGKPLKSKKARIPEPCGYDEDTYTELILSYPGITFELLSDKDGRNIRVISVKFTAGSKWAVSGLKIGATRKETIDKLGKSTYTDKSGLGYINKGNAGGASFNFKNGKLISVEWGYEMC